MSNVERIDPFPFVPAGVVFDGQEAHICVLAEDGWPHYCTVDRKDPAKWRRALASLADPDTATIGRFKRAQLRRPVWLGIQLAGEEIPDWDFFDIVLTPKGLLSLVTSEDLTSYADRIGCRADCRFDNAELLANYILRVRPTWQEQRQGLMRTACS